MIKEMEILGVTFGFKVSKRNDEDDFSRERLLKTKILYFMLILFIIVISKNFYMLNIKRYNVGDVITKNIYAPKTVFYNDKIKKNAILEGIIEEAKQKYQYFPQIKDKTTNIVNNFYDEVLKEKEENKIDLEKLYGITENKLSNDDIEYVFSQNVDKIKEMKTNTLKIISKAYNYGVISEKNDIVVYSLKENIFSKVDLKEQKIIKDFLEPNYVAKNCKITIDDKIKEVQDQIEVACIGDLVIKKGEKLDENDKILLDRLAVFSKKENFLFLSLTFLYLLICSIIFFPIVSYKFKEYILKKNIYRSLILIFIISFLIYRFTAREYIYFIPYEMVLFLLYMLYNKKFAFFIGIMGTFFLFPLVNYDSIYLILILISNILISFYIEKMLTRQKLIAIGMKIAVIKFFLYVIIAYLVGVEKNLMIYQGTEIVLSGIISGMLTIAVLPYFEKTFNILTTFALIELGDMSHPLLKLLSTQAPGTFHHSMMVSTLAEAAATAIGANPIFARVASYYHDIGKIKRAKFYVENQANAQEEHAKLSPNLSAMIIISHTKDGNELGREYKIPKEIRDIMIEHQGTTLLAYFYNKAKQLNPNVSEESFRYSGPIPQSKESAIIMLADSIEAAVRSLDEKTPLKIEAMLRKIIDTKIEEKQLVDSDITFRELEIIIKTFTKVLMSIHHVRIKYPGQK